MRSENEFAVSGHQPARQLKFVHLSYAICGLFVTIGCLTINSHPAVALFIGAILAGWSEVDGLCGTSHVGTLAPLRSIPNARLLWLRSILAYTVGGLITAIPVGVVIGSIPISVGSLEVFFIIAAGTVLLLRELGIFWFELPQVRRQTHKMWAEQYGIVLGAAMWGAHIGLSFATVITHGGFFVLVLVVTILGPIAGGLAFASYWVGRTLPIWTAAIFFGKRRGENYPEMLAYGSSSYRFSAACAISLMCVAMLLLTYDLGGRGT